MLDSLNAKRAALNAQRDQILANLNATIGAIAVVEELIAEHREAAIADAVREELQAKSRGERPAAPSDEAHAVDECVARGCAALVPALDDVQT